MSNNFFRLKFGDLFLFTKHLFRKKFESTEKLFDRFFIENIINLIEFFFIDFNRIKFESTYLSRIKILSTYFCKL